jgi:hypothetical protein
MAWFAESTIDVGFSGHETDDTVGFSYHTSNPNCGCTFSRRYMKWRSSSPVICPTEDGIPKRNPAGIQHEIHWRAKPFSQIFPSVAWLITIPNSQNWMMWNPKAESLMLKAMLPCRCSLKPSHYHFGCHIWGFLKMVVPQIIYFKRFFH